MTHRPTSWDEYIGQADLKRRLQVALFASVKKKRPLASILLVAPPGTGKSSLAELISSSYTKYMESFTAPIADRVLKEAVMFSSGGVLFIDEIHALTRKQQETLLPVLEDNKYRDDRGREVDTDPYTCILGATTDGDKIIQPLYDRFRIKPTFESYSDDELAVITYNMAVKYELDVSKEWATTVSKATLGVPRNARSIIEFARDLHDIEEELPDAVELLKRAQITPDGFTREHIMYLEQLDACGGMAGLNTMQQLLAMPSGYIERIEVDLIKKGIIERTGRGREMTGHGSRLLRKHSN